MTRKRLLIFSTLFLAIIISFAYYKQTHLSILGFYLPEKDIKDVIVQTEQHSYIIKDKHEVSKILGDASKMNKYSKIESFPPQAKPEQYKKLLIRTKDNTTYGGSIWVTENNAVLDSNGYYWEFDYEKLSKTLNGSIKKSSLLN